MCELLAVLGSGSLCKTHIFNIKCAVSQPIRGFRFFEGRKNPIFSKLLDIDQNHFLGVFFAEISVFRVRKIKKHQFEGVNELQLA